MAVVEDTDLDTIVFFAINSIRLPANVVVHPGSGQQVALIGGVQKHFAVVGLAIQRGDGGDAGSVFFDTLFAVEVGLAHHRDVQFFDPVVVDALGDVGFENPGALLRVIDGGVALAFVAVFVSFLLTPGGVFLVVLPGAMIELAGQAADDFFFAGVRPAETAGGKAAEVFVRGDDDDGFAHLFGLNRSDDSGAGATVDDDVVVLSCSGYGKEEGKKEGAHGWNGWD